MRLLLITTTILTLSLVAFAHSHSHEAPHAKYGREINEAAARGEDTIDHGHSHSHHGHSHSHDDEEDDHFHHHHGHAHSHSHFHEEDEEEDNHGHAHSHNAHGHSHEHGGCGHSHGESHGHSHGGHSHDHGEAKKHAATFKLYDKNGYFARLNDPQTRLWTYSLGATFLISAIPCVMLAFIPISSDSDNSSKLKLMLALGAGGLLGDVFLHLLPHAQEARESLGGGHGHSHSHGHSHDGGEPHVHDSFIGLWVLGGLLFFFVAEKLIRILSGSDSGHGHSHDIPPQQSKKDKKKKAKQSDNEESGTESDHDHGHSHERTSLLPSKDDEEAKHLRIVSWLNLISDFLHNTTDGMAIGASFIAGPVPGFWTTFMVFVHEIPHELGDFALLVRSGYSKPCAMLIQLATAIGAFIGCCIALNSVDGHKWEQEVQSSWVMPFTAGGFIYIATVSVLPELLNKSSFLLTIGEVIAMGIGVFAMYLIGFLEHMSLDEVLLIARRYGLNI